MNIRMRRSSARTSYTEISPETKPIPTTSMAGDCVNAVIAEAGTLAEVLIWFGDESRREEVNLWIHVLSRARVCQRYMTRRAIRRTDCERIFQSCMLP